jgi:hypothetical protein
MSSGNQRQPPMFRTSMYAARCCDGAWPQREHGWHEAGAPKSGHGVHRDKIGHDDDPFTLSCHSPPPLVGSHADVHVLSECAVEALLPHLRRRDTEKNTITTVILLCDGKIPTRCVHGQWQPPTTMRSCHLPQSALATRSVSLPTITQRQRCTGAHHR